MLADARVRIVPSAGDADRPCTPRLPVRVEPLPRCVLRLLPILAAWALVVVGRAVCLVAQRVPPAVWLVRAVQEQRARGVG